MFWLKFFVILAVIIILLLLIRVCAEISYNSVLGDFKVVVKVFGIKVFDSSKAKPKKPKKTKKGKKKSEKASKKSKKTSKSKIMLFVKAGLNILGDALNLIRKRLVIKSFYLEMSVASDEPSKTAINMGKANEYAYFAEGVLRNVFRIKQSKINIYPNFLETQSKTYIETKVTLSVMLTIMGALGLLIKMMKYIIGEMSRQPKTVQTKPTQEKINQST
ncbi:MAG: hypothetical protein IJC83_01645 [Oscillospiraceae bacterium]|nr:hypothetical protein [Oscillospiraceae bacterium]